MGSRSAEPTRDRRRDDLTRRLFTTVVAIVGVSLAGRLTLDGGSAYARAAETSTRVALASAQVSPTSGRRAPRRANWSAGPVAVGTGYHTSGGSDRVREVQRTLRRVGSSPGPVDGLFGPRTKQAVLGFQRAQGLRPDAIVGPRTLFALRSLGAADRPPDGATRSPGRPLPDSPGHLAPAPREVPTGDSVPVPGGPWPGILLTLGGLIVLIANAALAAGAKPRRGREAPGPVLTPSAEPAAPTPMWASGGAAGARGSPGRRLGELLRESGAVSEGELIGALEEQAGSGGMLGEILVANGVVPAGTLTAALARQLGFETLRRADEPLPLLSADEAQTWRAVPLDGNGRRDGAIPVALADPTTGLVATLEARLARPVVPRLCDEGTLDELLDRVYATDHADKVTRRLPSSA
jgi:peptidoglycan hydrolase-like protein with peptidoglycan-binding domain